MFTVLRMLALTALFAATARGQLEVESLDGRLSGELEGMSAETLTLRSGDKVVELPLGRVVALSQDGADRSEGLTQFTLVNGDRYCGQLVSCEDLDRVVVDTLGAGRVELPGGLLVGIEYPCPRELRERIAPLEPAPGDAILLKSGDRIRGRIASIAPREGGVFRYAIDTGTETVEIDEPRIWKVQIEAVESFEPPKDALYGMVRCWDGTAFAARPTAFEGRVLSFVALVGQAPRAVPLTLVESIRFTNGGFVYLSDLTPTAIHHTPYFEGAEFPPVMDRCRRDPHRPLMLRGRIYRKGISMQSRTRMEFAVSEFTRFRCRVGIDDVAGDAGSVVFRVYLDGKKVKETPVVRGGAGVEALDVDLGGASAMAIEADYADNAHVGDVADWVEALLIRK